MPVPSYLPIEALLGLIEEPNRRGCVRFLCENRTLFETVQGSTHNHQNWPGGYMDHVCEVMNTAVLLYPAMAAARPLTFSLSDALLALFWHDAEKLERFEFGDDGGLRNKPHLDSKVDHHNHRLTKIIAYGVTLTSEQENAIRYAEGEIGSYTSRQRIMGPLAAFCHMCDVASARIWYEHPLWRNDPWPGADRRRQAAPSAS